MTQYITYRRTADLADMGNTLNGVYSAAAVTSFYEQLLAGADADPQLAPLINDNPLINPNGKRRKAQRVAALTEAFKDKRLVLAFYNRYPAPCRAAIDILIWYGSKSLAELERLSGTVISLKNTGRRKTWEPFYLKSGFELLLLEYNSAGSYGLRRNPPKKDRIQVILPSSLADLLRPLIPKPAAYYITPRPEKKETAYVYCCEDSILPEISRTIKFIGLGHLTLKKNGHPTVRGLRALVETAGMKEIYPAGISGELRYLKVTNIVTLLNYTELPDTEIAPHKLLRNIFQQWLKTDFCLSMQLLRHLRMESSYYGYDDNTSHNIKKNLGRVLKSLPADGWADLEDIVEFIIVRRINIQEIKDLVFYSTVHRYKDWEESTSVTTANVKQVLYLPLLKAFFFMAAALGLVEIGYDQPENPHYQRLNLEYLSKYDGLRQVRLTKLGAYVSGKINKYTAVPIQQSASKFNLSKDRLLLTVEGSGSITALTLDKLMRQIGTGRYVMDFASFLNGCSSKRDVQKKIAMFKTTIQQKLPPVWRDFFKTALARVNPLTHEPTMLLFKVARDTNLLRLLTGNPDIARLIVKVEGLMIAVDFTNISKLTRLLRKEGYLLDNDILRPPL
ncbi:hypothetical protein ACOHYD_10475 [Desulfobacterota bacterium M19]